MKVTQGSQRNRMSFFIKSRILFLILGVFSQPKQAGLMCCGALPLNQHWDRESCVGCTLLNAKINPFCHHFLTFNFRV
jgi:hypothetical protein